MRHLALITFLVTLLLTLSTEAFARRGGLICGWTQMKHFGIRDQRYRLARNWLGFPRTSPRSGAVVVQWRSGRASDGRRGAHVARIVQVTGHCRALVADDRGTYQRDICSRGAVVVDPSGNAARHL